MLWEFLKPDFSKTTFLIRPSPLRHAWMMLHSRIVEIFFHSCHSLKTKDSSACQSSPEPRLSGCDSTSAGSFLFRLWFAIRPHSLNRIEWEQYMEKKKSMEAKSDTARYGTMDPRLPFTDAESWRSLGYGTENCKILVLKHCIFLVLWLKQCHMHSWANASLLDFFYEKQ